ncbi:MAG: xylulokinase [Christensenellaceae bacterium]|nr:xylulokinase [Christensenellaceae bacterium]
MNNDRLFIGIDVGTSSIKTVLINGKKEVLAQKQADYEISQPYIGWREIDPEIWYSLVVKLLKELLSDYSRENVDAIGITGQMHTVVFLDKNGKSIRPAILWDDIRTKEVVLEMREQIEGIKSLSYISKTLSTGSPAVNLYWLKKEEKDNFEKIYKFLIAPDYLVYKFTNNYNIDYCGASTSCLYDIKQKKWSEEIKKLLSLKDYNYPEIRAAGKSAGNITKELAEELNLRPDVIVATGTGDNPATAVSSGCLGQGHPVISLGTSGILISERKTINKNAKGKVILFSFDNINFTYLVQGAIQSNGSAYDWFQKDILKLNYKYADQKTSEASFHKNLIFYPHLNGEKTIYSDPDIKGAFLGLSTNIKKEDMMLALIEGLCFGYRELADKMLVDFNKSQRLRVVGGGAKSHVWLQTLSNILNTPLDQMKGTVSSAVGVALIALYCSGHETVESLSEGIVKVNKTFFPDKTMVEQYNKKYQIYKKVYKALKNVYQN